MSIRTLECPGVEIKEIDKSAYTPAMTGTRCFVAGYASKGEPYQPMEFTSKSAWQSYYGDPTNEAERYFYNACSEVINQNGVLYTARIPYDNKSYGKMVGYKFKVGQVPKHIPSAGEYLGRPEIAYMVDHDKDFETDALKYVFDNNMYREINGKLSDNMEFDDELQSFYNKAIDKWNKVQQVGEDWNISYYELDEENTELCAFDYEYQAREYLIERNKENTTTSALYITDIDQCIKKDSEGKFWTCVPEYKYIEKAELTNILSSKSDAESAWYKYFASDVTLVKPGESHPPFSFNVNINHVSHSDESPIHWSLNYYKINKDASYELSGRFLKEEEAMEYVKEVTNLGIPGLSIVVASNCIKRDQGDWIVQPFVYDFVKQTTNGLGEGTDELTSYNEAMDQYDKLLTKYGTTPFECWVDVGQKPKTIEVPTIINNMVLDDGYNDEFIFNSTMTQIYEDERLNLSAEEYYDAKTGEKKLFKNLWEVEIYEDYKDKSLKDILRDQEGNKFETLDQIRAFYKKSGEVTFKKIFTDYGITKERISYQVPYYQLNDAD